MDYLHIYDNRVFYLPDVSRKIHMLTGVEMILKREMEAHYEKFSDVPKIIQVVIKVILILKFISF